MIPPKRFDIFSPDWGMLRRSRCVLIFFKNMSQPREGLQLLDLKSKAIIKHRDSLCDSWQFPTTKISLSGLTISHLCLQTRTQLQRGPVHLLWHSLT